MMMPPVARSAADRREAEVMGDLLDVERQEAELGLAGAGARLAVRAPQRHQPGRAAWSAAGHGTARTTRPERRRDFRGRGGDETEPRCRAWAARRRACDTSSSCCRCCGKGHLGGGAGIAVLRLIQINAAAQLPPRVVHGIKTDFQYRGCRDRHNRSQWRLCSPSSVVRLRVNAAGDGAGQRCHRSAAEHYTTPP